MTIKTKHTALPFHLVMNSDGYGLRDADDNFVALIRADEGSQADFVLRACNNHYQLLAVSTMASDVMKALVDNLNKENAHNLSLLRNSIEQLEAAIKAAEQE